MTGPEDSDRLLEIGEIKAAYGIKGWVKIFSHTRPVEQIFTYSIWHVGNSGNWQKMELQDSQQRSNHGLVAKLKNINDRDAAVSLAGNKIAIDKIVLAALEDGEYYWSQLIGLEVINLKSEKLGRIVEILETGANDVLVVKNEQTERLIPYAESIVHQVRMDSGQMLVDWETDY